MAHKIALFDDETGTERTPYEIGYEAHEAGLTLGNNPFHRGCEAHWAWRNGWREASGVCTVGHGYH